MNDPGKNVLAGLVMKKGGESVNVSVWSKERLRSFVRKKSLTRSPLQYSDKNVVQILKNSLNIFNKCIFSMKKEK